METRRLANTDLHVTKLCLGTMTFGEQNTEAEAFAQMDAAVARGINFFDTAEMYAVPATAKTYGTTETILGRWFKARPGMREKIVLATKVCGRASSDWLGHVRGTPCLTRAQIVEAIDGSLRRLQTDYLDLYQVHWPDRNTNYFGKLGYEHVDEPHVVSIQETQATLTDLVHTGKVRHVGVSNETPWGLMRYLHHAQVDGLARPVSIQNPYNLLNRSFEVGLAEVSHRESVGLLAYSPMAFGVLSGKYAGGAQPPEARLTRFKRFARYTNPQATAAAEAYVALAKKHGLSPAQMALAFVTAQPFVTSNIIGATSLSQLEENMASADLKLSPEVYEGIAQIHLAHPNPAP
jgi:aryl-alcohol dehydrogenase-like predicted oxidoreductase